jgi:hypothetical protein
MAADQRRYSVDAGADRRLPTVARNELFQQLADFLLSRGAVVTSPPGSNVIRFETPADNPASDELVQIQIARRGIVKRLDVKQLGNGEAIINGCIRQIKRFFVTL